MKGKKSGNSKKDGYSTLSFGDFGTQNRSHERASSAQSKGVYTDNASNRRLGRVGLPLGSAVHNRATGTITNELIHPQKASSAQSKGVYTDNASNRRLGRVGLPLGSAVHNRSTGTITNELVHPQKASSAQSEGVYTDNASNRRLGRVGLPLGSAVHNRSTGTITNELVHPQKASSAQSEGVYTDNASNRRLGRVGLPLGSAVQNRSTSTITNELVHPQRASSAQSVGVYTDNASNRRLGRVGLPLGSAVHNRTTDTITNKIGHPQKASSAQSERAYSDNASNRRLGRVGLPLGSAVHNRSTSTITNELLYSRQLHTQGSRHSNNEAFTKSAVSQSNTPTGQPWKAYNDNFSNRSLDRAEMPIGSAEHEKTTGKLDKGSYDSYSISKLKEHPSLDTAFKNDSQTSPLQPQKVYKNNPNNRKLGRVGMPIGTAVFDKKSGQLTQKVYTDNPLNRKLKRVGLPRGSLPQTGKRVTTAKVRDLINETEGEDEISLAGDYRDELSLAGDYGDEIQSVRSYDGDCNITREAPTSCSDRYAKEQALYHRNRKQEEENWRQENEVLKTMSTILHYKGTEISYEDIAIGKQIGSGGFSEVYFANWQGSVVAVKKLKPGTFSNRSIRQFEEEMKKCCKFQHVNIVKFIGACLKRPNLCIVMEYMHMCLFHAIHISEFDFEENQKINIIQQVTKGLRYLHGMKTAHCDLKSHNILMNIQDDGTITAKISDFGLSMIKPNSQSSAYVDAVQHVGTPCYSAPEVLRGEFLGISAMMSADIYSLSLVYIEIIYEEEPFHDFTYAQLQQQVGQNGVKPKASEDTLLGKEILEMILCSCSFNPDERPGIDDLDTFWQEVKYLYKRTVMVLHCSPEY